MDNAFLTWLKSAVIFGIVFGLSGCDKLNSPKSTNTAAEEQPTQSQSIEQENTSKPSRTLLTRAFTHTPSFEPWFVRYPEQENLLRDLYEGLTAYDSEGRIVPVSQKVGKRKITKPGSLPCEKGFVGQMAIL